MVLLEAMAARTVVVASDIAGYRAAAGGHAVLVPPGDAAGAGRRPQPECSRGNRRSSPATPPAPDPPAPDPPARSRQRWLDAAVPRAGASPWTASPNPTRTGTAGPWSTDPGERPYTARSMSDTPSQSSGSDGGGSGTPPAGDRPRGSSGRSGGSGGSGGSGRSGGSGGSGRSGGSGGSSNQSRNRNRNRNRNRSGGSQDGSGGGGTTGSRIRVVGRRRGRDRRRRIPTPVVGWPGPTPVGPGPRPTRHRRRAGGRRSCRPGGRTHRATGGRRRPRSPPTAGRRSGSA